VSLYCAPEWCGAPGGPLVAAALPLLPGNTAVIIPYRVDVPTQRLPIANWTIMGLTVWAFFTIELTSSDPLQNLLHPSSPWVLGKSPEAWVGYLLAHGSIVHLAGNMLFLWVFGNAVCAKIGNLVYPLAYVGFGLAAAATHMGFDGRPAIGASGAINGVVGLFVMLYPLNTISCLVLIPLRAYPMRATFFSVKSAWIILLWALYDALGAHYGLGGAAYHAHLGGFVAGVVLGALLLSSGLIRMEPWEKSLFQVLGLERQGDEE
jgi:membrane associated rhomboid family serine protease